MGICEGFHTELHLYCTDLPSLHTEFYGKATTSDLCEDVGGLTNL